MALYCTLNERGRNLPATPPCHRRNHRSPNQEPGRERPETAQSAPTVNAPERCITLRSTRGSHEPDTATARSRRTDRHTGQRATSPRGRTEHSATKAGPRVRRRRRRERAVLNPATRPGPKRHGRIDQIDRAMQGKHTSVIIETEPPRRRGRSDTRAWRPRSNRLFSIKPRDARENGADASSSATEHAAEQDIANHSEQRATANTLKRHTRPASARQ